MNKLKEEYLRKFPWCSEHLVKLMSYYSQVAKYFYGMSLEHQIRVLSVLDGYTTTLRKRNIPMSCEDIDKFLTAAYQVLEI